MGGKRISDNRGKQAKITYFSLCPSASSYDGYNSVDLCFYVELRSRIPLRGESEIGMQRPEIWPPAHRRASAATRTHQMLGVIYYTRIFGRTYYPRSQERSGSLSSGRLHQIVSRWIKFHFNIYEQRFSIVSAIRREREKKTSISICRRQSTRFYFYSFQLELNLHFPSANRGEANNCCKHQTVDTFWLHSVHILAASFSEKSIYRGENVREIAVSAEAHMLMTSLMNRV